MKTKVTQRNWSYDRFRKAVVTRAKRVGVKKVPETKVKEGYEGMYSIPFTVQRIAGVKKSKAA